MNPVTTEQIKIFHAILSKNRMMHEKKELVKEISSGRAISTKDLFFDELQHWIDAMNASKQMPWEGAKMIRHIFAMAHELGWIKTKLKVENGMLKDEKDYQPVHDWVLKYGYLHKPLNEYKYKELPTLVTAFKNMYISKLKNQKQ